MVHKNKYLLKSSASDFSNANIPSAHAAEIAGPVFADSVTAYVRGRPVSTGSLVHPLIEID